MESPHRVYLKKQTKTTRSSIAARKAQRFTRLIMIFPKVYGAISKTVGLKTLISVPQMENTIPLKKKEIPTVTMITDSTGSPIIFRKKRCSVKIPRTNPTMRVPNRAMIKPMVIPSEGTNQM
jgi:hypothetical protein